MQKLKYEEKNFFLKFNFQPYLTWIIQALRLVQTQDASSEVVVNYRELGAVKCLC